MLCRRNLVVVINSKRRKEAFGRHGPVLSCCGLRLSSWSPSFPSRAGCTPEKYGRHFSASPLHHPHHRPTGDTSIHHTRRTTRCCLLSINKLYSGTRSQPVKQQHPDRRVDTHSAGESPSYRLSAADARISSLHVASSLQQQVLCLPS